MGNWTNKDGLFLQFGTDKATAEVAGEFQQPGANRVFEALIDLSLLNTSTATIISNTAFLPAGLNYFIEKVELIAEVAMSTASSPTLSVGIIGMDRVTVPSGGGTAFVNAQTAATLAAGDVVTLTAGAGTAGGLIGNYNTSTNFPISYLTAKLGTATATGKIRVRIFYHGVGTIAN